MLSTSVRSCLYLKALYYHPHRFLGVRGVCVARGGGGNAAGELRRGLPHALLQGIYFGLCQVLVCAVYME